MQCIVCSGGLAGRQRRFCSRQCKNTDTNLRLQAYSSQQARGRARRAGLIAEAGGRCRRRGYCANLAALVFHHRDPGTKVLELDLRGCSNRAMAALRVEAAKCDLLCANCHHEIHHPSFNAQTKSPAFAGLFVLAGRLGFEPR